MSVAGRKLSDQISLGQSLLRDRDLQEEMRGNQKNTLPHNAAENICGLLKNLCEKQDGQSGRSVQ